MTPTGRERSIVLLVVCGAVFLNPFLSSSLNLAVPAIGVDLGMTAVGLNWVVTAFLISSAAFLVPLGRLADLLGRWRVFVVGMFVQASLSLVCGLSTSGWELIVLRLIQGAASGMTFATSTAILVSAFPSGERGRVIGISTASVYVGLSAGPVLGGIITQHFGWRAVFLFSGGLGLAVAFVAALAAGPGTSTRFGSRFDVVGAVLYTASLLLVITGISASRSVPFAPWLAATGAVLLVGFCIRESRAQHPTLDLSLFGNVVYAFSNLAALINYSATFAVGFLLSLYLQGVRGLEPEAAGLVLLAQPVVMALLSPWAGRLSDRIEPRLVASAGMLLCCAALLGFAVLGATTPIVFVVAALVLIGIGFGLFSSPNSNAVMSAVRPADYGVASATLGTMRLVGQALSMALVAVILATFMGGRRIAAESVSALLASSRTAFSLFAVMCAFGVLASLARGRMHR